MSDIRFFVGKLIENEIGAFYEGFIFDRWLKIELQDGKIITIFDHELVFDGLIIGQNYEFITLAFSIPQKNLRHGLGKRDVILDIQAVLEWQPNEPFIVICPDILGKTHTVATTSLGGVVLGQRYETEIYIDDNQHKLITIRFDLLAVRTIR